MHPCFRHTGSSVTDHLHTCMFLTDVLPDDADCELQVSTYASTLASLRECRKELLNCKVGQTRDQVKLEAVKVLLQEGSTACCSLQNRFNDLLKQASAAQLLPMPFVGVALSSGPAPKCSALAWLPANITGDIVPCSWPGLAAACTSAVHPLWLLQHHRAISTQIRTFCSACLHT